MFNVKLPRDFTNDLTSFATKLKATGDSLTVFAEQLNLDRLQEPRGEEPGKGKTPANKDRDVYSAAELALSRDIHVGKTNPYTNDGHQVSAYDSMATATGDYPPRPDQDKTPAASTARPANVDPAVVVKQGRQDVQRRRGGGTSSPVPSSTQCEEGLRRTPPRNTAGAPVPFGSTGPSIRSNSCDSPVQIGVPTPPRPSHDSSVWRPVPSTQQHYPSPQTYEPSRPDGASSTQYQGSNGSSSSTPGAFSSSSLSSFATGQGAGEKNGGITSRMPRLFDLGAENDDDDFANDPVMARLRGEPLPPPPLPGGAPTAAAAFHANDEEQGMGGNQRPGASSPLAAFGNLGDVLGRVKGTVLENVKVEEISGKVSAFWNTSAGGVKDVIDKMSTQLNVARGMARGGQKDYPAPSAMSSSVSSDGVVTLRASDLLSENERKELAALRSKGGQWGLCWRVKKRLAAIKRNFVIVVFSVTAFWLYFKFRTLL